MSKQKKNQPTMPREAEIEAAKVFGKHVSQTKGRVLLAVTLCACAAPALLGLRLWDAIPAIYETGLVGATGEDDSLPRWAIVFAIPALMCLLNFLCHHQLRSAQKKLVVPKMHFRLVGRWGFPIISVLFAGGLVREAAGLTPLPMTYLTPCALGLGMMILGGCLFEAKEGALIALNFSFLQHNPILYREVNRFAAILWLAVGLGCVVVTMLSEAAAMLGCVGALLAVLAPWLYGKGKSGAESRL